MKEKTKLTVCLCFGPIENSQENKGGWNHCRSIARKSEETLIQNNRNWCWRRWPCIYSIAHRSQGSQGRAPLRSGAFCPQACGWSRLRRLPRIKGISGAESTLAAMLLARYGDHSFHRCGLNDAATTLGWCVFCERANDSDSAAKLSLTDLFCKCRLIVISFLRTSKPVIQDDLWIASK